MCDYILHFIQYFAITILYISDFVAYLVLSVVLYVCSSLLLLPLFARTPLDKNLLLIMFELLTKQVAWLITGYII